MSHNLYAYRTEADMLLDDFYLWELPGRGLQVWGLPVFPEPGFKPFPGHYSRQFSLPKIEDPPPLLIKWLTDIWEVVFGKREQPVPPVIPVEATTVLPDLAFFDFRERRTTTELEISLPAGEHISRELAEQFLLSLSFCRHALSFEVIGSADAIHIQFTTDTAHADQVEQQLVAHFPGVAVTRHERLLADLLLKPEQAFGAFFDFRLAREFMRPLAVVRNLNVDPLVGITGALAGLREQEVGLFQVIFQPTKHPWAESMLRAVTWEDGSPFLDAALVSQTRQKTSRPLFAAVVRVLGQAREQSRGEEIARGLGAALSPYSDPSANELMPLNDLGQEFMEGCLDAINRRTRHSGFIINSDELVSFAHPPSPSVKAPKFRRQTKKTKAAPFIARGHQLVLGDNEDAGELNSVTLSTDQRMRHMHVMGVSGTGKSTFLFNLIRQDIERGEGVGVLDPHGDLIDRVLGIIPRERIDDVVLIDPTDEEYSVGFNILSAHSDLEKNLLASDLVSVFRRLSTSWGEQMESVLRNAILAFLESSQGGTLADLQRFLIEPGFREDFLKTVRDPHLLYYWRKGFAQLTGNKSIGPVLTRLQDFLARKSIRYMVTQRENRLDFADIMDSGKIFLAKLPQGQIGKEESFLLGSLFVAKFQLLAMGRQAQSAEHRRPFFLYIDECHNYITPSMAEILSGARKYRLGLVLAHQELRQLQRDRDVESAILSNPYTRVFFRVGDDDVRKLADGFTFFEASDLQNLETGQALCRMEKAAYDFNLTVIPPTDPGAEQAEASRTAVITASRKKYGTLRANIESTFQPPQEAERSPPSASARSSPPPRQAAPPAPIPVPVTISQPPALKSAESAKPPADLGKGGAQHKAIQQRLQAVAEGFNYRVTIEKPILSNTGSVDLALERANRSIACEISVTTTTDHEVGNVIKCLKAGFTHIAAVSTGEERLRKIREAVAGCLDPAESSRVGYYTPDEFIEYLQQIALADVPVTPEPQRRRGYHVKRTIAKLTSEEAKTRETATLRMLTETMAGKRPPK